MTPEELLTKIVKILKELKIPYAITGGFGVSVWGSPRSTNDLDIVVEMAEKNVKPLISKVLTINKNIYADEDMVRDALSHKSEFNFIDPDMGFKIDFFVLADNIYNKLKIKRAIIREVFGVTKAYFVSPEDLILSKLLWSKDSYSQKQLEDVKTVLKNKKIKLDFKYLKTWAVKHGTIKKLENLLKKELV